MNTGAKHYGSTMPRCPACRPGNVIKDGQTRHGRQRYRCTSCGQQVHPGKHVPADKSGVVAGKIVIGRGSVWGAGRV